MPGTEDKNEAKLAELGDAIDLATFEQILEMDDGEDEGERFSQSIVEGFFDQARETFEQMDQALSDEDLEKLSSLGHFLKGSSATLGLVKIRDSCEKVQRYGKKENVDGSPEPDEKLCLERISQTLVILKEEFDDVEQVLQKFFEKP